MIKHLSLLLLTLLVPPAIGPRAQHSASDFDRKIYAQHQFPESYFDRRHLRKAAPPDSMITTSQRRDDENRFTLMLDFPRDQHFVDSCLYHQWEIKDEFPYFRKRIKTGAAPKSCCFSPDGKTLAVCLLSANGIDLYETKTFNYLKRIHPTVQEQDSYVRKERFWGYAEGQFLDTTGDFWFTRMTTGECNVYKPAKDTVETFDAQGSWTKVVSFSPHRISVAFSNWLSKTITIFNTQSRLLLKRIKTGKNPRGIAWIDEQTVAVALYGTGEVQVFDTRTGTPIDTISPNGHSARDICYDSETEMIYFSDSGKSCVRKYSWAEKRMIAEAQVDMKPNSIRLTPDGNYLFVSCRGPNNPKGYTLRSPRNGSLYLIRTADFKVITTWAGGNQPTGLALSPDGKVLASTDFQDHRVNLYVIAR